MKPNQFGDVRTPCGTVEIVQQQLKPTWKDDGLGLLLLLGHGQHWHEALLQLEQIGYELDRSSVVAVAQAFGRQQLALVALIHGCRFDSSTIDQLFVVDVRLVGTLRCRVVEQNLLFHLREGSRLRGVVVIDRCSANEELSARVARSLAVVGTSGTKTNRRALFSVFTERKLDGAKAWQVNALFSPERVFRVINERLNFHVWFAHPLIVQRQRHLPCDHSSLRLFDDEVTFVIS